jgi:capsular polysaccharide biosynthesis protein
MITDPVITTQVDQLMSKSYPGYRIEGHSLTTDQKPGSSTLLVRLSVQDTVPQRAVVAADMVAAVFIKRLKQLDSARYVHDDELLRHQLAAARTVAAKVALQLRNYVGPSAGYQALQSTLNGDQSTVQQVEGSYTQFQVTRDNVLTGVSVYSPAIVPGTPISPHPGRDALLSFVVVCMLGIVAIRLYDYVDDSLRNPEEVEAITGAPILGTIPRFSQHRESSARHG